MDKLTFEDIEFSVIQNPMSGSKILRGRIVIHAQAELSDSALYREKDKAVIPHTIKAICRNIMGHIYGQVWYDTNKAYIEVHHLTISSPYANPENVERIKTNFDLLRKAGQTLQPKISDTLVEDLTRGTKI